MSVSGSLNVLRVGRFSQTLHPSYPLAVRVVAGAASFFCCCCSTTTATATHYDTLPLTSVGNADYTTPPDWKAFPFEQFFSSVAITTATSTYMYTRVVSSCGPFPALSFIISGTLRMKSM